MGRPSSSNAKRLTVALDAADGGQAVHVDAEKLIRHLVGGKHLKREREGAEAPHPAQPAGD
jgi:hypothetical protein